MKQVRSISQQPEQDGSVVVAIIYIMLFLTTITLSVLMLANANLQRAYSRIFVLQAQYAAESGADAAIAALNSGSSFTGTTSDVTVLTNSGYKATYATTVAAGSSGSQKIITATGKVYRPAAATTPTYTRQIRVTAAQSSTTSASGLMSRNIIDVDSSVKNIYGSDVYLNGFVHLRSNVTNLYVTNLTVAGKDTGVGNCSIEGSGNLKKSTSLGAGQKANITMAYNNCINPPGNTSTTDLNITANSSSVTPIQSMYIPWSQYMDSTYQNSPGGCGDWTASGATLTIPSTGNTKKTHYPDSGSGIASSCGTSGTLNLGTKTYNITDNVHIRANLCSTACSPTFNNTSGSLKYIFVEGWANFASLHTSTGSSPIVFITYGADPGAHSNQCPYGDSIYLNKNGSTGTAAPALYLLATNSICLYQTKFDGDPATGGSLGGLGGKNLYIASNSGSPFDLALNPSFPVNSIPVNLAWRATGYERL